MMGRHYLLRSLDPQRSPFTKAKRRHYTITNCLAPAVYPAYLGLLAARSAIPVPPSLLYLVVKNYHGLDGVATKLCEGPLGSCFEVQGPMGKGLQIQQEGTHVAFAGGTGVLVFMDLVAFLVRRNMNAMS